MGGLPGAVKQHSFRQSEKNQAEVPPGAGSRGQRPVAHCRRFSKPDSFCRLPPPLSYLYFLSEWLFSSCKSHLLKSGQIDLKIASIFFNSILWNSVK